MFHLRHKPRFSLAAWVAITAVVLNALWPLVAELKPAPSGAGMVAMQMENCPDAGMHHAGDDGSAPDEPSPLMPQCGLCTLAAGGFTVLVAASVTVAVSLHIEEYRPDLPEGRPLELFSYSPAQPRAPPVLS